jgi:outer membrane protein OmpA-like peptidoglycan-associated protein
MRHEPGAETAVPSRRGAGRLLTALLAAVLVVSAVPVFAEERKHSWEAGAYLGYTKFGNETQVESDFDYGFRVGWNMAPPYELEFQYYKSASSTLQGDGSTLVANDAIFTSEPDRKFTANAYTFRFIINPRNERRRFKPYMALGAGVLEWKSSPTLTSDEKGDTNAVLFSLGGGIRYRISPHTQIRAELEDLYAVNQIYSNFHLNGGLTWIFGGGRPADSDGDGILDLKDKCPDTPKGALVDKHDGCPWDLDGDGVMEGLDQCPNTPKGWPVDDKGCPLDSDGDAVLDGLDKCPDTVKGAIVDAQGCPTDSDKDGIFDGLDKCPGTPVGAIVDPADSPTAGCPHDTDNDGVFDGVDQCALTPPGAAVDEKGCPKDSDGDRVLDGLDQCPDTPKGQKIDKEGCPRVRLDKNEAQILQNVRFHGIELYPGSDAWLGLLIDAAKYWPEVVFEVGIYTDNEGGVATNRAAAQRRSEVLKAWLIQQGIPASHFVMKAYGPVNFVADNSTEEGRDKNRRVEVKRLSGDIRRHPKPEPEAPPAPAETAPAPAPQPPATPPSAPATPPSAPAPDQKAPEKPAEPAPAPAPSPAPAPEPSPTPAPEPSPTPPPAPPDQKPPDQKPPEQAPPAPAPPDQKPPSGSSGRGGR